MRDKKWSCPKKIISRRSSFCMRSSDEPHIEAEQRFIRESALRIISNKQTKWWSTLKCYWYTWEFSWLAFCLFQAAWLTMVFESLTVVTVHAAVLLDTLSLKPGRIPWILADFTSIEWSYWIYKTTRTWAKKYKPGECWTKLFYFWLGKKHQ